MSQKFDLKSLGDLSDLSPAAKDEIDAYMAQLDDMGHEHDQAEYTWFSIEMTIELDRGDRFIVESEKTRRRLKEEWDAAFQQLQRELDTPHIDQPLKLSQAVCLEELGGGGVFASLPSTTITVSTLRKAISAGDLAVLRPNDKNLFVTRRQLQDWLSKSSVLLPKPERIHFRAVEKRSAVDDGGEASLLLAKRHDVERRLAEIRARLDAKEHQNGKK